MPQNLAERFILLANTQEDCKDSDRDAAHRQNPRPRLEMDEAALRQITRPTQPRPQHHKSVADGVAKTDLSLVKFTENQRRVERQNDVPRSAEMVERHNKQLQQPVQINHQRHGAIF